jgi:hypothetical protein
MIDAEELQQQNGEEASEEEFEIAEGRITVVCG